MVVSKAALDHSGKFLFVSSSINIEMKESQNEKDDDETGVLKGSTPFFRFSFLLLHFFLFTEEGFVTVSYGSSEMPGVVNAFEIKG